MRDVEMPRCDSRRQLRLTFTALANLDAALAPTIAEIKAKL